MTITTPVAYNSIELVSMVLTTHWNNAYNSNGVSRKVLGTPLPGRFHRPWARRCRREIWTVSSNALDKPVFPGTVNTAECRALRHDRAAGTGRALVGRPVRATPGQLRRRSPCRGGALRSGGLEAHCERDKGAASEVPPTGVGGAAQGAGENGQRVAADSNFRGQQIEPGRPQLNLGAPIWHEIGLGSPPVPAVAAHAPQHVARHTEHDAWLQGRIPGER